jgi:hypothetical protein
LTETVLAVLRRLAMRPEQHAVAEYQGQLVPEIAVRRVGEWELVPRLSGRLEVWEGQP